MADTKFRVFAENSDNIYNDNDYSNSNATGNNSSRTNGNQPNTLVESKMINTALKMATMIAKALIDALTDSTDLGLSSSVDTLKSEILKKVENLCKENINFDITESHDENDCTILTIKWGNQTEAETVIIKDIYSFWSKTSDTTNKVRDISLGSLLVGNGTDAVMKELLPPLTNSYLTISSNNILTWKNLIDTSYEIYLQTLKLTPYKDQVKGVNFNDYGPQIKYTSFNLDDFIYDSYDKRQFTLSELNNLNILIEVLEDTETVGSREYSSIVVPFSSIPYCTFVSNGNQTYNLSLRLITYNTDVRFCLACNTNEDGSGYERGKYLILYDASDDFKENFIYKVSILK